ncbi:unnamed protein product, partial [Musa acuminata var. zebrina]
QICHHNYTISHVRVIASSAQVANDRKTHARGRDGTQRWLQGLLSHQSGLNR